MNKISLIIINSFPIHWEGGHLIIKTATKIIIRGVYWHEKHENSMIFNNY